MRFFKVVALWLVCITGLKAQISVVPTVKHLASTSTPGTGAISLTVTGGTSPYSYTWTPGSIHTKDITSVANNTYVLNVSDSSPTSVTYTYNIGYKADWDQMYGCISSNDSLISNGVYGWSQAVTKNNLAAGTDGWVEYILKNTAESKVFGVVDSLAPLLEYIDDIDYGFYYDGANNYLYEVIYGGFYHVTSGHTEGTALRIERTGTIIKFVVNGVTVNTVNDASAAAKVWKVKALLNGGNSTFVNLGCSFVTKGNATFKNYSYLIPQVTHSSGLSINDGSVKATPYISGAYTYTWQPGPVVSNSITSKGAGNYSVTADDNLHHKTPMTYNIGYKCNWDQASGADLNQDTLIVKSTVYYGQAVTKNTLAGGTDGWFEYVLGGMNEIKYVGFTDSLSSLPNHYADIDFGYYYDGSSNYLYTFYKGSYGYVGANYLEGTVLRVERTGDTIRYKLNNRVVGILVSHADALEDWKVKAFLVNYNASALVNVGCSFYQQGNADFPNYVRLVPTITHLTGPSSNDGSAKVVPAQSGAYSYTWQPGSVSSSSVTSQPAGAYSVTVADILSNQNTNCFNIGYKVNWDKLFGCEVKHDTLAYTGANNYTKAVSKNTLPGGVDGWFEYVLKDLSGVWVVGFTDSLSPLIDDVYDIDNGFSYNGGNGFLYIHHADQPFAVIPPEGTVLRVERTGDTIRFKANGIVVLSYTDHAAVQKAWKLSASIYSGNLVNVGCSFYEQGYVDFPNYHRLAPSIVHSTNTNANDGSVNVSPLHGGNYSYAWQPGSSLKPSVTSATAGSYSLTLEDSLVNRSSFSYHVGYKITWDSLMGATAKTDTLTGTGVYTWGRGMSRNLLPGGTDGWLEYIIKDPLDVKFVGFIDSLSPLPDDYGDLDYGFYCQGNGYLYTVNNGALNLIAGGYRAGMILRVERIADTINLKLDGMIVGSVVDHAETQKDWRIKGILGWYSVNPSLVNVGCSFSYSTALATLPQVTNYTDEDTPGKISMNIAGGVPNYTILWNGMAMPDNHTYYLDLDSAFGGPVDTLDLYSRLDSLRRKQFLEKIQSAIYNNAIVDLANDTIHATTLVGTNFGWIAQGVATNTCVIPPDTASGFLVFYGGGQALTKTDPGTDFKYAISDCVISAAQREFYMEFNTINDLDEMAVGLKLADTLSIDSVSDMIGNTMIHFKGSSTHSMDIYYNNSLVYTGTYNSGDPIGILMDPQSNSMVYYRNFSPVWTQTGIASSFFEAGYQLKSLLKTPGAQLTNLILVGQTLSSRGMNATVTDVTCASLSSGSITFSGYSLIPKDYPCGYTATGPAGYSASGASPGGVLTGLSAGVYTISIQMRLANCSGTLLSPLVQTFTVAYMPDWINQAPFGSTNVNTGDRSFNTTASPTAWSGGASSDNMLDAGEEGWAEFKPLFSGVTGTNRALVFGLNSQDLSTLPADNDHGFYVASNVQLASLGLGGIGSSQSVGPYTATLFSLGNILTINNISPTDILKVKKASLNSGLNMKMEFYRNGVLVLSNPAILPSTELVADISVSQNNIYINKPRLTFSCNKQIPYYFVLKKVMDAGYYSSYRKSIYFTFDEEYYDPSQGTANSLTYKIVTDKNAVVSSPPGLIEAIGDNRFTIDLSTVTGMAQGSFYRIAITNKKNEVFYARFKY